jgi:hypothetical protein
MGRALFCVCRRSRLKPSRRLIALLVTHQCGVGGPACTVGLVGPADGEETGPSSAASRMCAVHSTWSHRRGSGEQQEHCMGIAESHWCDPTQMVEMGRGGGGRRVMPAVAPVVAARRPGPARPTRETFRPCRARSSESDPLRAAVRRARAALASRDSRRAKRTRADGRGRGIATLRTQWLRVRVPLGSVPGPARPVPSRPGPSRPEASPMRREVLLWPPHRPASCADSGRVTAW